MNTAVVAKKEKTGAYQGLGARIKIARANSGKTQEEFASEVGVRVRQVSRWETEDNVPREDQLARIAELGKVELRWLLSGLADVSERERTRSYAIDTNAALVLRDAAYPSLQSFLDEQGPEVSDAERVFLMSQRFADGEPSAAWWPKQLLSYRRERTSDSQTTLSPVRAAELEKKGIIPLKPGPKGKR